MQFNVGNETYSFGSLISRSNIKLLKGETKKYLSYGLSLSPYDTSGFNVCPHSTAGCRASCIFTSGNGNYPTVTKGRIARTKYLFSDRQGFKQQLFKEIELASKLATKKKMKLAIRLNVFSDIPWELMFPDLFTTFKNIQFYDYTKNPRRMLRSITVGSFPVNYHLTFSRSESNDNAVKDVLKNGGNVTIPFRIKNGTKLPKIYSIGDKKYNVIDGDKTDLRFLDKKNVIVGLKAKGSGNTDMTSFVVRDYGV